MLIRMMIAACIHDRIDLFQERFSTATSVVPKKGDRGRGVTRQPVQGPRRDF